MLRRLFLAAAVGLGVCGSPARSSDVIGECFGEGSDRRIEGCSKLLSIPGLSSDHKSLAYAMRALAYSLKGEYGRALPDYDAAITLDPHSALALNNRAWTLFKSGEAAKGLTDANRSIELAPSNAHAHDTRAHIFQAIGQPRRALNDYNEAMRIGGERIIKLYQCGLRAAGLFSGDADGDGDYSPEFRRAMETCVLRTGCDPLPPGEDCAYTTS